MGASSVDSIPCTAAEPDACAGEPRPSQPSRLPRPLKPLARAALWAAASVAIGLMCGGGAVLLSLACETAALAGSAFPPLILCLPVLAALTCWLYRVLGVSHDISTASVFARQRDDGPLPTQLAPAILAGTALSVLGGGSVGKEAAALQLGGALAAGLYSKLSNASGASGASGTGGASGAAGAGKAPGKPGAAGALREFRDARDVFVLAGMAAAFASLMFAPVAATLLVLEVARPSRERLLRGRMLCVPTSAAVAFAFASLCDVERLWHPGSLVLATSASSPAVASAVASAGEAAVTGSVAAPLMFVAACTCAGIAFVWLVKRTRSVTGAAIPNVWVRAVAGALVAVVLNVATGGLYAGTGANLITAALAGEALPVDAFAVKAAITCACLGFGIKGGEVMPALAVGACLGCAFGQVAGVDTALYAALGTVAVFSACSLCPLASLALALEAFGFTEAAPLFAIAALVPGAVALAVDVARLCATRDDVRTYLANPSLLAQGERHSNGLFVR